MKDFDLLNLIDHSVGKFEHYCKTNLQDRNVVNTPERLHFPLDIGTQTNLQKYIPAFTQNIVRNK